MASTLQTQQSFSSSMGYSQDKSNTSLNGRQEFVAGIPIYVTGNKSSKMAVIDVHHNRIITKKITQQADAIASTFDALVLVPDFTYSSTSPDSENQHSYLSFRSPEEYSDARLFDHINFLMELSSEAKERWSEVEAWGVFGLPSSADESVSSDEAEAEGDLQIFYNPLAALLHIKLTLVAILHRRTE